MILAPCGSYTKEYVRMGTASITGSYYPFGNFVCRVLNGYNRDVPKGDRIICSVQTTPGTLYNRNSLLSDGMEFAVLQNDLMYKEYKKNRNTKLRMVYGLHDEALNVVVHDKSDIMVFDDIVGSKINASVPGTGTRFLLSSLFTEKSWEKDDFYVYAELRNAEQVQSFCDYKIDVMTDVVAIPSAIVKEALVTCSARVLGFDKEFIDQVVDKYRYYTPYTIPMGIYSNDEPINTLSVRALFVVDDEVSDEVVYQVTKNTLENLHMLQSMHGTFKNLTMERMLDFSDMPYKIHHGACRYYQEKGYDVGNHCDDNFNF